MFAKLLHSHNPLIFCRIRSGPSYMKPEADCRTHMHGTIPYNPLQLFPPACWAVYATAVKAMLVFPQDSYRAALFIDIPEDSVPIKNLLACLLNKWFYSLKGVRCQMSEFRRVSTTTHCSTTDDYSPRGNSICQAQPRTSGDQSTAKLLGCLGMLNLGKWQRQESIFTFIYI